MKKFFFILCFVLFLTSCQNYKARYFGGEINIEIPQGYNVKMAAWKNYSSLWVLYESNDTLKKTYLQEYSTYGILQGRVNFQK